MHETNAFDNYHPQALVRTLKTFAFEQSTAFRDDRLAEVELSNHRPIGIPSLIEMVILSRRHWFVATRLIPTGWRSAMPLPPRWQPKFDRFDS